MGTEAGGVTPPAQAVFTHTAPSLGLAQRDMEGQLGKYGAIFTVARFTTPSSRIRTKLANGSRPVTGWTGRTRRLMWTGR